MIKFLAKDNSDFVCPLDVPANSRCEFFKNYQAITKSTGRLFLFTADHRIEHLAKEFFKEPENIDPETIFKIAAHSNIGALATHLGYVTRYANGEEYRSINYIIKLNGKTNLVPQEIADPKSEILWSIDDILEFKKTSGLNICGVGYTIYLGSAYEGQMLSEAAQLIYKAHKAGLVTILWMYPRGKSIKDQHAVEIVAGAAAVANSLGADFAKIIPPKDKEGNSDPRLIKIVTEIAGNTKIICSGGQKIDEKELLKTVEDYIKIGHASGIAFGRNVFERPFEEAIKVANQLSKIVYNQ